MTYQVLSSRLASARNPSKSEGGADSPLPSRAKFGTEKTSGLLRAAAFHALLERCARRDWQVFGARPCLDERRP